MFFKLVRRELDFFNHLGGALFDFLFALIRNMGNHRILGVAVPFAFKTDLYFEAEKLRVTPFQVDDLGFLGADIQP